MEQNTALTTWEKPESLQARVQRMLEIQQNVMKKDIDYGIIPGCGKPSLFKPGAELLMVTFCLADRVIIEEIPEGKWIIRYRVTTELYTQSGGVYMGCGVGEASTEEDKYKWRKAICQGEWEEIDPENRREKWFRGNPDYKVHQVRTNPSDVANTVLKMAKKRSKIDAVLSVLGASRIYTQDIEDMSRELQELVAEQNGVKSRSTSKPIITQDTVASENYVQDVSIKTGTGENGPWKKYGVKINGKFYGTFSETFGEQAMECKKNNTPVIFTWEQAGKYKNLLSLQAVQKKDELPANDSVMDHADFCNEIKGIAEKCGIDKVDEFIKSQTKIDGLDNVPAEMQSTVIDLFNYQLENAGK